MAQAQGGSSRDLGVGGPRVAFSSPPGATSEQSVYRTGDAWLIPVRTDCPHPLASGLQAQGFDVFGYMNVSLPDGAMLSSMSATCRIQPDAFLQSAAITVTLWSQNLLPDPATGAYTPNLDPMVSCTVPMGHTSVTTVLAPEESIDTSSKRYFLKIQFHGKLTSGSQTTTTAFAHQLRLPSESHSEIAARLRLSRSNSAPILLSIACL